MLTEKGSLRCEPNQRLTDNESEELLTAPLYVYLLKYSFNGAVRISTRLFDLYHRLQICSFFRLLSNTIQ